VSNCDSKGRNCFSVASGGCRPKGNAEILKAEKLKSGPGIEAGIAQQGAAYYPTVMTTISLKLPENLLARLERESRARRTTKSSVVRECLEQQLPDQTPPLDLPELPPGESFYDKALPILKKAWARRGRGRRDLATNPKYMEGFGR
jgi:hypothetical protein